MCELIIIGGRCINVASTRLIDKLQLATKVHPTLYSLQWLKQGSKVTVSKQALIAFSIGAYCGETLCDVLPMDSWHLSLVRPWLFDNHVIRNGHVNAYAFKYKGRSLTLIPLPLHKPLKFKPIKESEKSLCMSETQVKRAISKSTHLFSLRWNQTHVMK